MTSNGLDITEEQFMRMDSKERDLMMFRNLTHIRKKFKDYSFHRKINYVWLFALSMAIGLRKYIPL